MVVPQSDAFATPLIWGHCIVHLGNPLFSGKILHTSSVVEITRHKSIVIAETRNNYYGLLGPELVAPAGVGIDPIRYIEQQSDAAPQMDSFASAAMNADRDCPKCHATGVYQRNTGSLAICNLCCKHNQGWWQLEGAYGPDNGRWACKAGCGTVLDHPLPELEFLPRAVAAA